MRAEILVLFQSDVVWHNIRTFDKNDFLVNLKEEYNQSWRVPMPTLSMFFGIIIRMQSPNSQNKWLYCGMERWAGSMP